ncbi:AraC family transcriptional regulator [Nonomuraea solani]|uniref:AraC family transcriptional regulator n=1 Tax=Nonomuraea solani TaxID=1144553 RepID=A0A1H6DWE9_9ACTN|nr:AraC family transcriptional regulator [Nonomuraea solani]SEG89519.1 AraC family transcriptional regulator [Nonomuraea solani]
MNERKVDCECHRPRDLALGEFYGDVVRTHASPQFVLSEIHHPRGRVLPTHAHQAGYFSLLVEGHYAETYDGRRHEYDPLTVWWHRPGVIHDDTVGHSGGRFFNVELTREGTDVLAEAGPARRDFHEQGTKVVWLACRLLRELRHWRPCSTLIAENLALEMAGCALHHPERPEPQPAWLDRVVQKLHDEPNRRHYTAALAREAGVHPVYLASVFRRIHRQTIGEYLRILRIRRATNLLRHADMPLAQVAVMLGFADQAHFTRIFSDVVGMTPSVFRRLWHPRQTAEP